MSIVEELLKDWKDLKHKSEITRLQNYRYLNEIKDKTHRKPKVYSLLEDEDAEPTDIEADKDNEYNKEYKSIEKLMSYSIREYEDWEKKHKPSYGTDANESKNSGEIQHDIAKRTYEKAIKKQNLTEQRKGQNRVIKKSSQDKLHVVDDARLVNELVKSLNEKNNNLIKKLNADSSKHDHSNIDAFINEKNKKFNEKLEKEWQKFRNP